MPLVLLLALALSSGGAKAAVGIKTLRGIDKIKVVVEDLTSASSNPGVSEDSLRDQIELELKRIGIKLVNSDDLLVPILYLSLTTQKTDGAHDFVLHMELLQAVTLARDPAIKASSATTWSTFRFARVDAVEFAKKVRTLLSLILEDFLADYQAVNPKR
jgi:hypothetical protein